MAILMGTCWCCSETMALTPSTMLPLETVLPAFSLPTVEGGELASSDLDQRPVLLMVICAHCPFVKHIEPELTRLEQDYGQQVQLLAISLSLIHILSCRQYAVCRSRWSTYH